MTHKGDSMKPILVVLVVIALAVAGAAYYATHLAADPVTSFRTVAIKRGDLLSTIPATGPVEAEERVDVGAQVVGMIKSLGVDPGDPEKKKTVDYCTVVHKGTVLALIDDAVYQAQKNQAEALLARSEADLLQLQAKCDQAEREWKRAESLYPAKAIADTDYDLAVANYKAAKANVAVGLATIKQNKAALELAKTNLAYTVITSPVEGTIIDRRVDVGQTVVSSLNAPSLFLIAKDLRRMQVWAGVNEMDIGRIRVGMPVQFTVDAYSGEVFRGKVAQIRLNAQSTQNVVTYTVVVATDNSDLRLFPYMTATVYFEVEQRTNVLLVPNAALRWKPRPQQIDPEMRKTAASPSAGKGGSREGPAADKPDATKSVLPVKDRGDAGRLWVPVEGFVRPLTVTVGPSDGVQTEISGSGIKEGMEVVIGEGRKDELAEDVTNPFAPKLFGGQRKQ
jgi:HlyD family secretion protein